MEAPMETPMETPMESPMETPMEALFLIPLLNRCFYLLFLIL